MNKSMQDNTESTARRHRFTLLTATMVAIAATGAACPAMAATNLVVNGGFESAFFAPGWTQFGDQTFTDVLITSTVSEGTHSAWFGPSATGGISQAIALQAGAYLVAFDVAFDGFNPTTSFAATFDGQTLVSVLNPPASSPGPFQHYSFNMASASAHSATLQFSVVDQQGFVVLDAVNVSAVPEPTSVALLAVGLAGVGYARRKARSC